VDGVRALIDEAGAELWYLPPYSQHFNPIEKCFSQVKQLLRAVKARSLQALEQAATDALAAVTADNTKACYRYYGYGL
jgi:transposase